MPKALELRKVIEILRKYGIGFNSKSGGRYSGKFVKGGGIREASYIELGILKWLMLFSFIQKQVLI